MNLSDLILKSGDANVGVQMLSGCATSYKLLKKGGTEITFVTDQINPIDAISNKGKVGMVIWIKREDWETAMAEAKRDKL